LSGGDQSAKSAILQGIVDANLFLFAFLLEMCKIDFCERE
jgi:hypothetical protein